MLFAIFCYFLISESKDILLCAQVLSSRSSLSGLPDNFPHLTISWVVFENKIKLIDFQKQPIFLLSGKPLFKCVMPYYIGKKYFLQFCK